MNKFIFSNLSQKIKWIKTDFSVYQADPFGIEKDGNLYLFYEEYLKNNEYAILKCSIYDTHLRRIDERVILDDGTHKSFPFVFENNNQYYLMPESGALDKLIIYESIDFPFEWGNEKVLLHFACSDAILKKLENKWYLFYSKSKVENENEILYMRSSEDLFCDWDSQKEFIGIKDYYSSRNAGNIYKINGNYYRFSQNCLNQYGENIVVNHITNIDIQHYTETFTLEKKIQTKNNGFHTLNATEKYVLVDRRFYRLKLKSFYTILNQLFRFVKRK